MATRVFQVFAGDFSAALRTRVDQIRHGHYIRGKSPTVARTLKQRLEELNKTDPEVSFKVNIGLPVNKKTRREVKNSWMTEMKIRRSDPEWERASRNNQLLIDLEKVREVWLKTNAYEHMYRIANHYGVFQDLFGDAYFYPTVPLEIYYELQDDICARVYTGNVIKSFEACKSPLVKYEADANTLWTLMMVTPDGNIENSNNEFCHWFVGNIPGNQVESGQQLVDYMRPIPPQGVGYYRYIFILYKQHKHLDFEEYKKSHPCLELSERNWNTLDFYRKYQDDLTPAGLAFFQSDWDPSLKEFYHLTLNTKEPIFEYDFPKPYIKPQTWFPLKEPFNLYLDKYRDPKEINKEFLLRKLKKVHPFKAPEPAALYPNAYSFKKDEPSWLKLEKKKSRLGWGRINDIN